MENENESLGRILIVDDEVGMLKALTVGLEAWKYETVGVTSGKEALIELENQEFDLLLTDLVMPEIDGIELITAARKIDSNLVSIVMTGHSTIETAVKAMKSGAFDYILKPFELEAMDFIVKRAFEFRRLRNENIQLEDSSVIYELSQVMALTRDPKKILNEVIDAAVQQFQADEASIMLISEEENELEVSIVRGHQREHLLGTRVPLNKGIVGWVARKQQPIMLNGEVLDERFESLRPRTDIGSSISMPMLTGKELVGVLNLSCQSCRRFTFGQIKALTILANIAAAVLGEARLSAELQKLTSAVEQSSSLVLITDLKGRIEYINPAFSYVTGYRFEEIKGKTPNFLKSEHTTQREYQQLWTTLLDGNDWNGEFKNKKKDGTFYWASASISPVKDSDGKITHFISVEEDISERKKSEEVLLTTNQKLENTLAKLKETQDHVIQQERLNALGTMASGIAHDFNNTLSPIMGYTELLLMQPDLMKDETRAKSLLNIILTSAQDASNIVSRLREFYRRREPTDEEFTLVEINPLIEKAIFMTQPKWKDQALEQGRTITMRTHLQAKQLVYGNESELREMFTNLIFNAVDAISGKEGSVTLKSSSTTEAVNVEIIDTGVGMTEEVRNRCMEPFFTTKGERGTGMGLSMVFGIIERHEGSYEIESEFGKGTTLRIGLPVQTSQSLKKKPITKTYTPFRPLHVLVVEDDPKVTELIKHYLTIDGHTFETAPNGAEALDLYKPNHFDVVLTDMAMPKLNGKQLASRIKQRAPDQPIVMLTGFGNMMKTSEECPQCVDWILSKPIKLEKLKEAFRKVVKN